MSSKYPRRLELAAAPRRADDDPRLAPLHKKVLRAIAKRDRRNVNGLGCFASNVTLANDAGCHPKSISTIITDLIKWGYICDVNAPDGCRRGHRDRKLVVIYDEDDLAPGGGAATIQIIAPQIHQMDFGMDIRKEASSKEEASSQKKTRASKTRDERSSTPDKIAADQAWYRAYQERIRRAEEEITNWKPATAAERERAQALTEQRKRYGLPPQPTQQELRDSLRQQLGDKVFGAKPDGHRLGRDPQVLGNGMLGAEASSVAHRLRQGDGQRPAVDRDAWAIRSRNFRASAHGRPE